MPCEGIQLISPMPTIVTGDGAQGVGICSNQYTLDTFIQINQQNLQLIAECFEETFSETLTLPGVPQITLSVPGLTISGLPSFQGDNHARVPQTGRSYISNVLPMYGLGGQAKSSWRFGGADKFSTGGQSSHVPGRDPLDLVFEYLLLNYEIIVNAFAEQGVSIPLPAIPQGLNACGQSASPTQPGLSGVNSGAVSIQQIALDALNKTNQTISNELIPPCALPAIPNATLVLDTPTGSGATATSGCWTATGNYFTGTGVPPDPNEKSQVELSSSGTIIFRSENIEGFNGEIVLRTNTSDNSCFCTAVDGQTASASVRVTATTLNLVDPSDIIEVSLFVRQGRSDGFTSGIADDDVQWTNSDQGSVVMLSASGAVNTPGSTISPGVTWTDEITIQVDSDPDFSTGAPYDVVLTFDQLSLSLT